MKIPEHKCGLHLEHNVHKNYYEKLDLEYMLREQLVEDFENSEDMEKSIAIDSLWTLQWYPDTPISSYRVAASSLEKCLELAIKIEQEIETDSKRVATTVSKP